MANEQNHDNVQDVVEIDEDYWFDQRCQDEKFRQEQEKQDVPKSIKKNLGFLYGRK